MAFERIELNLIPDGEMPVFHCSQFDVGRPVIIDLMVGDDAYTPSADVTFELHCRKVDDNIVTIDTYEVDENTVTFASTEQLCACVGDNLCEVSILLDELVLGTLNFILHVEPDPLAGGLTSETSIYNLTEQVRDITEDIIGDDYYNKTQVDDLLDDKADKSTTYTKTEVDTALNLKADKSNTYTKTEVNSALALKADASDIYTKSQTDTLLNAKANTSDLATVATTGNYNDLTNKPTIPAAQVQSNWTQSDNTKVDYIKNKPTLATVATSGSYDDLTDKPTIPAAQIQSDYAQSDNTKVDYIKNKPDLSIYATQEDVILATGVEEQLPYQTRPTPSNVGNKCLEKVVGVSCAFNQLVNTGDTSINTTSGRNYITKINSIWSIIQGGSVVTIVDDDSDMVIDLTALFGMEIADYLYTLESGTAGAGVALFRKIFNADYYPYTAITLMSAKPTSKVIKDANNQTIVTYPFGGAELRGLFKKDADGNIYADGDIYEADGTIQRIYGSITFDGSTGEFWQLSVSGGVNRFLIQVNDMKSDVSGRFQVLCNRGIFARTGNPVNGYFGFYDTSSKFFYIPEQTITTVSDFKTWLASNNLTIYYPIDTPTTESSTAYDNPQMVGAIEEFTDIRIIKMPCGHDTIYSKKTDYRYWG